MPLVLMSLMEKPFEQMEMGIVGPLVKSTAGYQYILVLVDYTTCYLEAVPLRTISTEKMANELRTIFTQVGLPKEIITDQGSNLMPRVFWEV